MPLGDDQDTLKTTLAVITTRLDYISANVTRVDEQVKTLLHLPANVAALTRDMERISVVVERMQAQEAERRPTAQPPMTLSTMAMLLILVAVAAAVTFGAVYLGGRLGQ